MNTKIRRNKAWMRYTLISLILLLLFFQVFYYKNIFIFVFNTHKDTANSITTNTEQTHTIFVSTDGTTKTLHLPTTLHSRFKSEAKNDTAAKLLFKAFNEIGGRTELSKTSVMDLEAVLNDSRIREYLNTTKFLKKMTKAHDLIKKSTKEKTDALNFESSKEESSDMEKLRINLATVACGDRTDELETVLKSVALFSQDAILHVIVFTDKTAMVETARIALELKWTAMAMGWELTFEMHDEWFPGGKNSTWKSMYEKCATQRLFFPSLLKHIDSVIYVDTDTLILSNLTELWMKLETNMKNESMVAMAQNNEPSIMGHYSTNEYIPYILPRGANAGVMLMNLTQMRQFKFEKRAIEIQSAFKEKIILADQDIVNILFSVFKEKAVTLDCSYNFYWVHCGDEKFPCHDNQTNHNTCFCRALVKNGVHILHGNTGSFFEPVHKELLFFAQAYKAFEKLNLLTDSYLDVFRKLEADFEALEYSPCAPLTVDQLYRNAFKYLKAVAEKAE